MRSGIQRRPRAAGRAVLIPVEPPYDLSRTLSCGQCFRWTALADGTATRWRGVVAGAVVTVAQAPDGLTVTWHGHSTALARHGLSPAHLRRHLGVDEPLAEIEAALARDRVLLRLLSRTSGIAIMHQDPWECLVSYVVSAFNNIPKIGLSIERLARRFGEPIFGEGDTGGGGWAFPSAERLAAASPAALRACALGYRARYVRDLARMVANREIDLPRIATMPFDDARAALLALPGVGEKVADCVLLFAFGHGEAFPVDVWVARAVGRWYFGGRLVAPRKVRRWARDRFGPLAGYAQQHLFVGARLLRDRVP